MIDAPVGKMTKTIMFLLRKVGRLRHQSGTSGRGDQEHRVEKGHLKDRSEASLRVDD